LQKYNQNKTGKIQATPAKQFDFIEQHPVWDGEWWRQRGQGHGIQPFVVATPNNDVVLTWPTDCVAFTLQSTTNLVSLTIWSTVSPGPVIINGQNVVTNPISGKWQFYRLSL